MANKKLIRIAKAAGELCSIGAGVITIALSVVAAFVAMPVFVTFVVAAGVGLVCAYIGARNEANQVAREAAQKASKAHKVAEVKAEQQQNFLALKEDLDEIRKSLELHHENLTQEGELPNHPHLDQAQDRAHRAHQRFTQLHSSKERNSLFFRESTTVEPANAGAFALAKP